MTQLPEHGAVRPDHLRSRGGRREVLRHQPRPRAGRSRSRRRRCSRPCRTSLASSTPTRSSARPVPGADKRWKYVLNNMVRDGNITAQQAAGAMFPACAPAASRPGTSGSPVTSWTWSSRSWKPATASSTEQQIDTKGYRITTTFSQSKIKALVKAVAQEKAVLKQQAALGAGSTLPYYDHIGAVLEDAEDRRDHRDLRRARRFPQALSSATGRLRQNNAEIPQPGRLVVQAVSCSRPPSTRA